LSNKQRSSKWKANRHEKFLAYINKKKKEEPGNSTFELLPQEEYRQKQRAKMVLILDAVAEGTEADDRAGGRIADIIAEMDTQQLTNEQNVCNWILSTKLYWEARFLPKPDKEWYKWTEVQQCEPRDYGMVWCVCCSKYFDEGHKVSSGHVTRVEELACCNMMMGIGGARRFAKTCGLMGRCNAYEFKRFWGEDVDRQMTNILKDKLKSGTVINVELPYKYRGKPFTKALYPKDIESLVFAPASYGGDGKYLQNRDCCLDWSCEELWQDNTPLQDAPALGHVTEAGASCKGGDGEVLIREKDEALNYGRAVDGRGWWPVCAVFWEGQHRDARFEGEPQDYRVLVMSGSLTAYVLCWYQLHDGSSIIQAWPCFFRSRL
jgi:hypothetical protein